MMEVVIIVVGVLAVLAFIGFLAEQGEKKAAKQSNPALASALARITSIQNLQNVVTDYTKQAFEGLSRGDASWSDIEAAEQWNRHRQRFLAEASSFDRDHPGGLEPPLAQLNIVHDEAIALICKGSLEYWLNRRVIPAVEDIGRMHVVLESSVRTGGVSPSYRREAEGLCDTLQQLLSQYRDLCRRYAAMAPTDFSRSDKVVEAAENVLRTTRSSLSILDGHSASTSSAQQPTSKTALEVYAPYVRLGMAMARADGDLASEEVRALIDFMMKSLDLPSNEMPALKTMMKEPVPSNLKPHVDAAIALASEREAGASALMSLLVRIAKADNVVHRDEVRLLQEVAKMAGWNNTQFESFANQHNVSLSDPWQILGVSPNASWSEVRKAFKAKMADYHPDKVAQMPPEFQMLAHQKCTEFNASLEAIKAHLGA